MSWKNIIRSIIGGARKNPNITTFKIPKKLKPPRSPQPKTLTEKYNELIVSVKQSKEEE